MATIGSIMSVAETGWKSSNLYCAKYIGNWYLKSADCSSEKEIGTVVIFRMKGTAVRVLYTSYSDRTTNCGIYIDGVKQVSFNQRMTNTSDYTVPRLMFETTGLSDTIHEIKIVNESGDGRLVVKRIDILQQDKIVHHSLNEVSNISDIKNIGDTILCKHTSLTSGQVGYFSELGTTIDPLIPTTSSATPNGSFYWVYVGKDYLGRKKFIADRNIQHSISWNTLNNAGIINERSLGFKLPIILSNVSESGHYSSYVGTNAFNESNTSGTDCWAVSVNSLPQWLQYNLTEPVSINSYSIQRRNDTTGDAPKAWTLQASNDGINWTIIDTRSNEINWSQAEARIYDVTNKSSWLHYRVVFTESNNVSYLSVGELSFYQRNYSNNYYIRLLSGGTSSTDTDNEWDKIIVNSNLGGTITPGDNNVWNWNGVRSWASTTSSLNTKRTVRGSLTENLASFWGENLSSYVATGYGFRPVLLVETLNTAPMNTLTVDRDSFYQNSLLLIGNMIDNDNDNISYKISVNNVAIVDWTEFKSGPIEINEILNLNVDSLIQVTSKDIRGGVTTNTFTVYKKEEAITHVDYAHPSTNYLENYNKISNIETVLLTVPFELSYGYVLDGYLNLNIKSGILGTIQIGLITSTWKSNLVTYQNRPILDTDYIEYTVNGTGLNQINITALLKKLYSQPNYGIYIKSDNANITLDVKGNDFEINYQPTIINQPEVVYGDRCGISWQSLKYENINDIQILELWRDTSPDFSTELKVFETTNFSILDYMDNELNDGTYYYRIKAELNDTSIITTTGISVPVPLDGYKNVLVDEVNIVYTTELTDGLAFDDPTIDYDFYTTPDKIKLRSLNMGTMIGGRTQSIYVVEVINSYTDKNFLITLRGMTTDGIVAEEKVNHGLLYDSNNQLGRTKIELSNDVNNFNTVSYPLQFNLNAGQRKNVYIRITPTIYNTVGTKQLQLKLTGKPL